MRLVLVGLVVVGAVVAQDCSSPGAAKSAFGAYLSCIKAGLDADYGRYEEELRSHGRRAAQACFASSIPDGNARDRCVILPGELDEEAWGRKGPLKECSICRTFAAGAMKAIRATPAEDQRCIRNEITKAISREANLCISRKIANFPGVPDIPDLEEGSFQYKESVIGSISDFIVIHSRLSFCGGKKPARAQATQSCLANPFVGYLQEHCKILQSCDSRVAVGSCASIIPQTRVATCQCIHEARDDLKRRINSISSVINEVINGGQGIAIGSSNKVDICVNSIKKQMVTPVNDWVTVIDSALSTCIRHKPAGQNLGMEALLNVGCRKVIADTTGSAADQLRTGFNFVNNLIDAMVDRSGRFCGGEHCFAG